jgi:hypothetical protein
MRLPCDAEMTWHFSYSRSRPLHRNRKKAFRTIVAIGALIFLIVFTIARSFGIFQDVSSPERNVKDEPATFANKQSQTYRVPDGEFYGLPLYFVPGHLATSSVHCVGNNFQEDAWYYRSCEFRHLCFNATDQNYFLVPSPEQEAMEEALSRRTNKLGSTSTTMLKANVSLKTLQHGFFGTTFAHPPWFPSIKTPAAGGYYELPSDIVWVPIRTQNVHIFNPGHLIWDYYLPIFTLLSMFGLEDSKTPLVVDINPFCTELKDKRNGCFKRMTKFLALVGTAPGTIASRLQHNTSFSFNASHSETICVRHAVAGTGMLNDHGRNKHGSLAADYAAMRNVGRGPEFYRFRNFMLRNMGIGEASVLTAPFQIVLSLNSSSNPTRMYGFEAQIAKLQESFDAADVVVRPLVLADLPLKQQLQVVSETAVYISVMGGSAVFASFLPRGSTVVLFFNDAHDWVIDEETREPILPVKMDWDFFNNAAYLQVHWFPVSTMNTEADMKVLVSTIRNGIEKRKRDAKKSPARI